MWKYEVSPFYLSCDAILKPFKLLGPRSSPPEGLALGATIIRCRSSVLPTWSQQAEVFQGIKERWYEVAWYIIA
ncbi:hypothetical protein HBI56_186880 [Parastagonospora nodorum]|uniref:Uncharacterized protein n=1 Tax=Phaeosphaeria nodorum (strain SN15 / ATCC MYA-4574 / FGSC 10173) TaxID=321614 RepID=Q0U8U7_PHANO|nr:hypothetical protein SNOG_11817 [Parastagonospora nodorum SN15]KAH3909298.1 hypothetical protein HBH56_162700 [Parastagonospora nodorum]EAT80861.1 hypothetical protein SNOG_11817 [Parastagonospora nodorum SN15]KAH3931835.1 hypothetical protein HBH54_086540 [Parastagonospora nodorum]KAH3947495.1 hypothetical protein HBH53_113830 [Parastagonospora nodorum]KAH3968966.1 hypothetical protein HBH52_176050 [Parastagonospora nodorum]